MFPFSSICTLQRQWKPAAKALLEAQWLSVGPSPQLGLMVAATPYMVQSYKLGSTACSNCYHMSKQTVITPLTPTPPPPTPPVKKAYIMQTTAAPPTQTPLATVSCVSEGKSSTAICFKSFSLPQHHWLNKESLSLCLWSKTLGGEVLGWPTSR